MSDKTKEKFPAHWVKATEFVNSLSKILNQVIEIDQQVALIKFLITDDTRRAELDAGGPHKLYSIQSEV